MAGQQEFNNVIDNASIVYNNQLKFFDKYIEKAKPGLSSIQSQPQKTISEKVKLRR